ncbi:MAG: metallophosphoesterase family protein [Gammaproteobacteria bacterium]|nr:metallophosphoesterase family protein [Gammaproteobacteria bacterium]
MKANQDRILVFGGPYSNLAATLAMQQQAHRLGIPPHCTICTGDLVAYCAEPRETVELIQDWGIQVVMGNCEESLAENRSDCGCGFTSGSAGALLADDWFPFASQHVTPAQRDWMAKLPRSLRLWLHGYTVRIVHASPSSINRFIFPSTPVEEKVRELRAAECDILVGGHSGIPFGERLENGYWLNSGVIGLPANDGTCDGWYMLLESAAAGLQVSWHRLRYDWRPSAQRMSEAQLRPGYRQALGNGLWPSMDILPAPERRLRGQPLAPQPMLIERSPGHAAVPGRHLT